MYPLLAHVYEPRRVNYDNVIHMQPKLNGVRALSQFGCFQSRDRIPWNKSVLAHLGDPLRDSPLAEMVLDGELYLHGRPLQDILSDITPVRTAPTGFTHHIEYHIFDRVEFRMPFAERIASISEAIQKLATVCRVRLVPTYRVPNSFAADSLYAKFVEDGYEGAIYRVGDCPYTMPKQPNPWRKFTTSQFLSDKHNRVWHLLKRKDFQDDEFMCIGVEEGQGKRSGMVGAYICKTFEGKQFKVGGGFTELQAIRDFHNPPVGRFLKVKYLVLSNDGIPTGNTTLLAII